MRGPGGGMRVSRLVIVLSLLGSPLARGEPLRSEEHTSELQSRLNLVCRLLLEKKKTYELSRSKPVDLYFIARRRLFGPLIYAQYGSATFVAASRPATIEVRIPLTGLLARWLP